MNQFITDTDYATVCTAYELEIIQNNKAERIATEQVAIETVASYTRHRYDMDRAFNTQDGERNPMLVQAVVNITLWLMIHRLPQNMGHERRECLYNDTIQWLKDVQSGKATPNLPAYEPTDPDNQTGSATSFGSMPKNTYDY